MSAHGIEALLTHTTESIFADLHRTEERILTADELEALEVQENAAQNSFSAAIAGVRVIQEFIYSKVGENRILDDQTDSGDLNDASWALGLLGRLAEETSDIRSCAQSALIKHYKRLA